ncbi:MAG: GDP-mannose 4,6-dehydratase [Opitutaceae bacterium]|nr:GDP-mannose 4,6-dehydratase [Opitutaceae bacterium]
MKILITGACGFIGTSLSLRLKKHGLTVVGIDCLNAYYNPELKRRNAEVLRANGITLHATDLASDDFPTLDDVGVIVHLAAQPGISQTTPWEDYHRNNILATHRLLQAACAIKNLRFINIATSSVYGLDATGSEETAPKPASWYGVTKLAAEQEVLAAHRSGHLSACSLRLFSVFGERERPDKLFPRLVRALMEDSELPVFEGSLAHRRSFSYVGDICEGIASVMHKWPDAAGQIFNIGTDKSFTTGEAIETAESITGKRVKIRQLPARPGDQTVTQANIDKIRSVLGWEPRTSLRTGLESMIAWYATDIKGKFDWS